MKHKKIIIIGLILLATLIPVIVTEAESKGYWETFTYSCTIEAGVIHHHQFNYSSGLDAYARLKSSSGECTIDYVWSEPWLHVFIWNKEDHRIDVTWEEIVYLS
jgi:galactose mutarotase-like enzyme